MPARPPFGPDSACEPQTGQARGTRALRQRLAEDPLPRLELADLIASWCVNAEPPADCDALLDEAEQHYREGLRIAPDDAEHRYGLARPRSPELSLEAGRGSAVSGSAACT
jgi:hypothetical protein